MNFKGDVVVYVSKLVSGGVWIKILVCLILKYFNVYIIKGEYIFSV